MRPIWPSPIRNNVTPATGEGKRVIMNADREIPAWYHRDLTKGSPDVVATISGVTRSKATYYFTGAIREFIRARKIPIAIAIALDMDEMAVVARLEFEPGGDGHNEDGRWRSIYTYMDIESFAVLWNEQPGRIHGIPSDRITLHLNPNDIQFPTTVGTEPYDAVLFFKDDRFWLAPDMDMLLKEKKAA